MSLQGLVDRFKKVETGRGVSQRSSYSLYDVAVRAIVLGDEKIGKASLVTQFTDKRYAPPRDLRGGVDFDSRLLKVEGIRVKIQIYTPPGYPGFAKSSRLYLMGQDVYIVCYSARNVRSFEYAKQLIEDTIPKYAMPSRTIVLAALKCDRYSSGVYQAITTNEALIAEAQAYADLHKLIHIETSARDGSNVERLFTLASRPEVARQQSLLRHAIECELSFEPDAHLSHAGNLIELAILSKNLKFAKRVLCDLYESQSQLPFAWQRLLGFAEAIAGQ